MQTFHRPLTSLLLLLSTLFLLTHSQNATACSLCPQTSSPVCVGSTRYLNPCSALCKGIASSSITQCTDKKVQDTQAGNNVCYCPLLDEPTCLKNQNSGKYLNPCFAHCFNSNLGYTDFETCGTNNGNGTGNSLYTSNTICSSCNTTYSPVCINGVEFINSCYANCYHQNEQQSSCFNKFSFINEVSGNNCICVNSVDPVCVSQQRYANPCLANCAYPGIQAYPC